jgi:hypothetical protein
LCRVRSGPRRSGKAATGSLAAMFGALVRLVLYRYLGARILLALTIFGWLRRLLGARRDSASVRRRSAYQPSQGTSQTVQRDPR